MPHLSIGILASEGPLDGATFGIATALPGSDFGVEGDGIGDAPVEALWA